MKLEPPNILKFHCTHNHLELPVVAKRQFLNLVQRYFASGNQWKAERPVYGVTQGFPSWGSCASRDIFAYLKGYI